MNAELGKIVTVGIVLVALGLLLSSRFQIPWLGRLPGDFSVHRGNFHFYFPLATSILISLILTALLYFFRK